jgi:hypothetical protein
MEDYELLQQLKAKSPEAMMDIIGQVLRAFNDYERNVGGYRKARARLLQSLDPL